MPRALDELRAVWRYRREIAASPRLREVFFAKLIEKLPLCRIIWGDDGSPYLLRIYLLHVARERLPGVFLHYFFRSDNDREIHGHPWSEAASIVLTGGYTEERWTAENAAARFSPELLEKRVVAPGALNIIRANDFHRVQLLKKGCWTLFIAGERVASWGFIDEHGNYEDWEQRDERLRLARG